jgi:VanZ family protein
VKIAGILLTSVLIISLSLIPGSVVESRKILLFSHADKIVHFMMYAFLMFVWLKSMKSDRNLIVSYYYIAGGLLYCTILGIILELLQYRLAVGRSFEVWDIVANIAGALTVILLFKHKNN